MTRPYNSAPFKGITAKEDQWAVQIVLNGVPRQIVSVADPEIAAIIYNMAFQELRPEPHFRSDFNLHIDSTVDMDLRTLRRLYEKLGEKNIQRLVHAFARIEHLKTQEDERNQDPS